MTPVSLVTLSGLTALGLYSSNPETPELNLPSPNTTTARQTVHASASPAASIAWPAPPVSWEHKLSHISQRHIKHGATSVNMPQCPQITATAALQFADKGSCPGKRAAKIPVVCPLQRWTGTILDALLDSQGFCPSLHEIQLKPVLIFK